MIKVLSFDPAGEKFGIAGVSLDEGKLSLYFKFLLESPDWDVSRRNTYVAHASATIAILDKPNIVVSEKPFGIGYSAQSLKELIGAIKAELATNIAWQGISEARKAVLGDGYGGSTKRQTAEWLLQYNWDIKSKRTINEMLAQTNDESKDGYDILDAIVHALCYLIQNLGMVPVHKPLKEKKRKKSIPEPNSK